MFVHNLGIIGANTTIFWATLEIIKWLGKMRFLDEGAKTLTITLSNSKAKVTLTFHNAWDCIESLLTDPCIKDSNYAFHQDDPLSPPPPVSMGGNIISKLHTATACYEA
jgi:hypothetical protein